MARNAGVAVRRRLETIFASGLIEVIKGSAFEAVSVILLEIAADFGKIVSDTKVKLTFVTPGYMIRRYITKKMDVNFEKEFFRK